jgi:hypothetical protein
MVDVDTFLTTLYVIVEKKARSQSISLRQRGAYPGHLCPLEPFRQRETSIATPTPNCRLNDRLGRPRLKFADLMGW